MSRRANGEGSIWLRADGRWSAGYYVPKPGGGRVRRYVYGRTREEVSGKLVALAGQVQQGVPVPVAGLTVGAYLEEWLVQVARQRVRAKTFEGYASNVRRHLVPRLGRKRLGRLTAREVRLALDDMAASGLSQRSVQYVHATLRTALEHAVREELLARNVARLVSVPTPTREERVPLTVEEARLLLKATRDDRLHALYVVLLLLGLRRGEGLGLRWQDVDLDEGVLRVRQTLQRVGGELRIVPPKTRRSRRTVPLPRVVAVALAQHAEQTGRRHGLVFTTPGGTPIDPRNFSRAFGEACVQAGVRPVRLHDLRHTCVSLLLSLGVHPRVVMEIVGHSALEMTMNVYGHVALDAQRDALGRLDDLLGD